MLYHGHAPKAGTGDAAGSGRCNPQAEHPARAALRQKDVSLSAGPALGGDSRANTSLVQPHHHSPVLLRTTAGTANTQLT